MAEHTPEPWNYEGGDSGYISAENPYGRGLMHVGEVRGFGHLHGSSNTLFKDIEEAKAIQDANGTLMAAAPQLLKACQHTIHLIEAYAKRNGGEIPFGGAHLVEAIRVATGVKPGTPL